MPIRYLKTLGTRLAAVVLIWCLTSLFCTSAFTAESADHWADEDLSVAKSKGILSGYPDGSLRPDASVTRAEFAAMVCRAIGEEDNVGVAERLAPAFPDLSSDHWALGYLRLLKEAEIMLGDESGSVHADDHVTRAEVAVLAARVAGHLRLGMVQGSVTIFGDVWAIPDWAAPSVVLLASAEVFRGDDLGLFRPEDPITRSESVAVLLRLLKIEGSKWEIEGSIKEVNGENGTIRMMTANEVVTIRCVEGTSLYRHGARAYLGDIRVGDRVGVVLVKRSGAVAAVVSCW